MELYAEVAYNLNKKGILPFAAREYNTPLIQRVVYGRVKDKDVMNELKIVMTERNLNDLAEQWKIKADEKYRTMLTSS